MMDPEERARRAEERARRADEARAVAVSRRAIVLPVDLWADVQKMARAEHFESVQAFIVVTLQALATARLVPSTCADRLRKTTTP